jgi:hypothetical protein
MYEIKSFKIFQTATVIAVLYAIESAIFVVIDVIAPVLMGVRTGPIPMWFFFSPILYAIAWFIGTALMCWFYNQVAARIGGIAFELLAPNDN